MTECMICQYDDAEAGPSDPEVYVVEKPRGTLTICEVCDTDPFKCADCGNRWMYGGNADRPTCPNCRGKRTSLVAE